MPVDLESLEKERDRLFEELSQIGDFRRGSISCNYRRCGKAGCACSGPEHPGHGPQHLLTFKDQGKSRAKNLRPGPELEKAHKEVASHRRFRELVARIVQVNERICEARPPDAARHGKRGAAKKKSWKPSARSSAGK